jgi:non-heme chloroperoxidase
MRGSRQKVTIWTDTALEQTRHTTGFSPCKCLSRVVCRSALAFDGRCCYRSAGEDDVVYLGTHGSQRVSKAIFMAAVPPFLLKTPDNPEGVDNSVFEGIKKAIAADRPAFLSKFLSDCYNVDALRGTRVSDEVVRRSWNIAAGASPTGTLDCVSAWVTDFRPDLARIDVPTLIVHGEVDRILPLAASGKRTHELVKGSRLVVEGGPHGLNWTHAEEVNRALLGFLWQNN